jgi:RimJ/RimL family protein N-acetyltransferase
MLVLRTFPHPLELRTRRTLLRQWKDADLPAWVAMNADPEVRRHFPTLLSEEEARAEAQRVRDWIAQRGWGIWALEIPGVLPFAGVVGLHVTTFEAPFVPCVELGWRLSAAAWGRGYATEAASAATEFAFDRLDLPEVVAFTIPANTRSRGVMEKLGMRHDPADDFEHPRVEPGHPMRPHVLYRLTRENWRACA